jgi:hypothetical protein
MQNAAISHDSSGGSQRLCHLMMCNCRFVLPVWHAIKDAERTVSGLSGPLPATWGAKLNKLKIV